MNVMVQSIKGTRDFYPEEKRKQNYIFSTWQKVALKYGFEEMDGPVLEPAELWEAKGDELGTQLYAFKDKGDRKNVLRPEMTPTVARMVAAKTNMPKPIKWFSIQRLFRYEAPQKGRLREHWQLNVDTLGLDNSVTDAEVIAVAIDVMRAFGCTEKDFFVRISSRELMNDIFKELKIKNPVNVFRVIDKKEKVSAKDYKEMLKEAGLNEEQIKKLNQIMETADLKELKYESAKKLREVINALTIMGFSKYVKLDLTIARGFSYYTGVVFEVFDKGGKYRSLAGGGRYDNLVSKYSSEKIPGIGFGMGDATMQLFLEDKKKIPKLRSSVEYFIAVADGESLKKAITIANTLRKNHNVEMNLAERSLGKQFQYAANKGIPKVVVVGQKDLLKKQITIKTMDDGKQKTVKLINLKKL